MKPLYIAGAGGFGREVWQWAHEHPDCGRLWNPAGFLDDNPNPDRDLPGPLCGSLTSCQLDPANVLLVNGLGLPQVKASVCPGLVERGFTFLTLIHPSALVSPRAAIGQGSVICPFSICTDRVATGAFVTLNCRAGLGHDSRIGDYSTMGPGAQTSGYVAIGSRVLVGGGAFFLQNVEVGNDARISAGSVVLTNVAASRTAAGNPAKIVGKAGS